ncbi:MAG TPA: CRISPR system precrRNA processing endoribonuclease RAMP protein Cas6 [Blastocatellia bacterium]|nr:CRISPR system precrRNA processing endoribonuclease RAMP protein Cas6 [Blastocatellia bacterium]
MEPEDFSGLDVARYRLTLRAIEDASLPAFLGSTLRGAFGHALKQAVCVMSHKACERCMVEDRCLYPYLFETPPPTDAVLLKGQKQAPHPFILTPPFGYQSNSGQSDLSSQRNLGVSPRLRGEGPVPTSKFGLKSGPLAVSAQGPATEAAVAGSPAGTITGSPAAALTNSGKLPRLIKPPPHPYGYPRGSTPARGATPTAYLTPRDRTYLKAGESLPFELVLLGRAIDYLPYIVFAVSEMARRGLGVGRVPFKLDEVVMLEPDGSERQVYSGRTERIAAPALTRFKLTDWLHPRLSLSALPLALCASPPALPALPSSLRISFLTPTRIRVDGDPQSAPSFDLLVRSLLRRISMLMLVHGRGRFEVDYKGLISRASEVRIRSTALRWWDFERYSNRQQTKMKLGGFVGEIEYEADARVIGELLPLVVAGEVLHIGSNTTFGLGLCKTAASGIRSKLAEPDRKGGDK